MKGLPVLKNQTPNFGNLVIYYNVICKTDINDHRPCTSLCSYQETVPILPQPSEASLATLMSMGFDRNSAMQALLLTRNDLNAAPNLLLEAQSH